MANSVFRDTGDGGSVSIFISGSKILFACEKGHWWIVEASEFGDSREIGHTSAADRASVSTMMATFGSAPLAILGLDDPSA
jgi:hypothetical protein